MEKVLSAYSPCLRKVTKVHQEPGTRLTYNTSFLLTRHDQRPWLSSHVSATMSQAYYGHHRPASAQDHHGWDAAPAVALRSSSVQHPKWGDLLAHRLGLQPHGETGRALPPSAARVSWRLRSLPKAPGETGGMCSHSIAALKRRFKMQCQVAPRSQTAFPPISLPEAALPYQWARKRAHSKILASFKVTEGAAIPPLCNLGGRWAPPKAHFRHRQV